jgi:hypothetical protein
MKFRIVLAIVILVVLSSAPAFAQEQLSVASGVQGLIDSGTVSTISVLASGGNMGTGYGNTNNVKVFRVMSTVMLVLENGSSKFYIDLSKAAAYAYESKTKALIIWIP